MGLKRQYTGVNEEVMEMVSKGDVPLPPLWLALQLNLT